MQYTTNYNLKKPGYGDIVDPKDYNDNFNTIDSTLKSVSDAAAGNAYSAMTQAEADAGTATTARTITPKVLKDTISSKALSALLEGYAVGSNTPIAATDSILGALGKLQGQVSVGRIKSVQKITAYIPGTAGSYGASANISISPVNVNKCIVSIYGFYPGDSRQWIANISVRFASSSELIVSGQVIDSTGIYPSSPWTANALVALLEWE